MKDDIRKDSETAHFLNSDYSESRNHYYIQIRDRLNKGFVST